MAGDEICEVMIVVRDGPDDAHEEPCHASLRWFVAREIGGAEPWVSNTLMGCMRGHSADEITASRPAVSATTEGGPAAPEEAE